MLVSPGRLLRGQRRTTLSRCLTVDVGCGEGRLTRALAAADYRVVGADTASALVKAALTHPRSAPAIVADATRLPFPDESADLVIAFMCLHDFDDMSAAVAEAARILTPANSSASRTGPGCVWTTRDCGVPTCGERGLPGVRSGTRIWTMPT